jgi:hypothetical protein
MLQDQDSSGRELLIGFKKTLNRWWLRKTGYLDSLADVRQTQDTLHFWCHSRGTAAINIVAV